jgi:hypothetical protein
MKNINLEMSVIFEDSVFTNVNVTVLETLFTLKLCSFR